MEFTQDSLLTGGSLALLSLSLLIIYLLTTLIHHATYKLPPGPPAWPLIGNAWGLIGQKNLHEYFVKLSEKYGPVFSIKIGNVPHVVVNSADLALEIYVKKIGEFVDRPLQYSMVKLSEGGRDLATQNFNPFLKAHRKLVSQSIRLSAGNLLDTITHQQCAPALDELTKMTERKEPFSPRQLVLKTVYKLYFKLILGLDMDYNDPNLWNLAYQSKLMAEILGIGLLEDLAPSLFQWLPSFGGMKKAIECRDIFKTFIHEEVMKIDKFPDEKLEAYGVCGQMLLARREMLKKDPDLYLTDDDVVYTVIEMFLGGADSIANIVEWLLLELANHPRVQEKMYAEIVEAVGDREVSVKDRINMPYTEAATWEVLRTGLAAPINVRGSVLAHTQIGGYDIPRDTPILINHHALHTDRQFWGDDVHDFRPERFLNKEGRRRPKPKNFIPFAGGSRSCVGESLSKENLFTLAVIFLQKFKFCKPPGVDVIRSEYHGGFIVVNTEFDIVVEERK